MVYPADNNKGPFHFSNEETSLDSPKKSINDLPNDCMLTIFQFLFIKDILAIEQAHSCYLTSDYTKHTWKRLCYEKNIKVDWSTLFGRQNDPYSEKFTYRTDTALRYFLDDRKKLVNHLYDYHDVIYIGKKHSRAIYERCVIQNCIENKTKKIEHCFKSVGTWNLPLGDYILQSLNFIKTNISLSTERLISLSKEKGPSIESYFDHSRLCHIRPVKKSAGELLLCGLDYLGEYDVLIKEAFFAEDLNNLEGISNSYFIRLRLASTYNNLNLAMLKGATHASLLAKKIMKQDVTEDLKKVFADLAMIAANQKDYRPLEECLLYVYDPKIYQNIGECHYFLESLFKRYNKNYPPMLLARAAILMKLIDYNVDELPTSFGRYDTPLKMAGDLRDTRLKMAECYFQQSIESYQQEECPILPTAWWIGAHIKASLEKWNEADNDMQLAIAGFGENIPVKAWRLRASIKESLGDFKEAILSLKNILEAYEDFPARDGVNHFIKDGNKAIYWMGKKQKSISTRFITLIKNDLNRLLTQQ